MVRARAALVALVAVGFAISLPALAADEAVLVVRLDPGPGIGRALLDSWDAAVVALGGEQPRVPSRLPAPTVTTAPERLVLSFARARDAWSWRRALAPHAEPHLLLVVDPPEIESVGADVPATMVVRLAPAVERKARDAALSSGMDRLARSLEALSGVDAVSMSAGGAPERPTARLRGTAAGSPGDLRARLSGALPEQPGGRLRIHGLASARRAKAAAEDALAAWEASGTAVSEPFQVTPGREDAIELIGAAGESARRLIGYARPGPGERLALLATPPGPRRQGLVLLREPPLVDLTESVLGAAVELTSDFEPVVRVALDEDGVRRLLQAGSGRGGGKRADERVGKRGERVAVVLGDDVLTTLPADSLGRGDGIVLHPSSRRGAGAVDAAARSLAVAIRDAPWPVRVTIESVE